MTECPRFEHLLVLPHLSIQNCNAINGSNTYGISITAFIGAMHVLERKARAAGWDWQFMGVGVVVHDHELQATSGAFVRALHLTRNPLAKDGSTAAIVEEGRMHLSASLVFGIYSASLPPEGDAEKASQVREWLAGMRLGGGSVWPNRKVHPKRQQPYWLALGDAPENRSTAFAAIKRKLLPGFALVERSDLLPARLAVLQAQNPQATALDAWLSLCRINWHWDARQATWLSDRPKGSGWIVPIPVGYAALTDVLPAGSVAHARDSTTPFRFVEGVYAVGEWLGPHRLQHPEDLMWWPEHNAATGLYRCRNGYKPSAPVAVSVSDSVEA